MHSNAPPTPVSPESIAAGHESSTVGVKGFIIFVVVVVGFGLFIHVIIWLLMVGFAKLDAFGEPVMSPVDQNKPTPPAPWLQPSPLQGVIPRDDWEDLANLREQEHMILTTYGKDDATGGIRIPVSRAMEILVEQKKLPTAAGAGARQSLIPSTMPNSWSSGSELKPGDSKPGEANLVSAPTTMKASDPDSSGGK